MDLSKPSYVHIEKLDRQLEALEHDLRQMENENGITEEYIENYQRQKDHLANRSRITDKSNKSILKSG
jgi:cell division protein FtsB